MDAENLIFRNAVFKLKPFSQLSPGRCELVCLQSALLALAALGLGSAARRAPAPGSGSARKSLSENFQPLEASRALLIFVCPEHEVLRPQLAQESAQRGSTKSQVPAELSLCGKLPKGGTESKVICRLEWELN